jgi:hypothetical protein
MKKATLVAVSIVAGVLLTGTALAAVTFDPATGAGFVGKGDVQDVFGWNNKGLQDNAGAVQFQAASEVVTEVSWICTNSNNQQTQERARTTTTTVEGVVSSVGRLKNQITGFNLLGYDGAPSQSSTTDGPALNSCPAAASGWALTTPAGDPEEVSSTSSLQVSVNGTDWFDIG